MLYNILLNLNSYYFDDAINFFCARKFSILFRTRFREFFTIIFNTVIKCIINNFFLKFERLILYICVKLSNSVAFILKSHT